MKRARGLVLVLSILAIVAFSQESASACSVCFGNPDSNLTKGIAWGIISLLGIVMSVVGGIVGFFIYQARRSASLSDAGVKAVAASTEKTL